MGWLRNLSFEMQVFLVILFVALVVTGFVLRFVYKKVPRRLNQEKFQIHWQELQAFCKRQETWADAVQKADSLLDNALKQRRYKGKKMGERIVSAQKKLSDNDGVWFAHNLAKRIAEHPEKKLSEADVKKALVGFRQALRDLGALKNE